MIAAAWALFAVALGCGMIYRFGGLADLAPRWASALLILGAGTCAGIGISSCLFFLCRLAVPGGPRLSLFLEVATLVGLAYEIRRKPDASANAGPAAPVPFTLLLTLAIAVALAVATGAMADAWEANPQGNWDAWSIWNLRARFLAAGGTLPQRAWSPGLSWTHPEYPLLIPAFVARCWTYAGSTSDTAPIATSYAFFIALIAILTGGLAAWRSPTLGLLCGLALLGSPHFLHEVPAQYADIPLACYFAAATIFALLDRPLLAGLFAGLAAWTKHEGLLFLLALLAATAILRRRHFLLTAAAAMPVAILVAVFKFVLAPRLSEFFVGGASALAHRAGDLRRIGQVLAALAHEFAAMSMGWYHPVLPLIALAIALRFDRPRRGDLLFAAAIPIAMLSGYVCIELITPNDLSWQLQTSLSRLLVQIWPGLLLIPFACLRTPESAAIVEPRKKPKSSSHR